MKRKSSNTQKIDQGTKGKDVSFFGLVVVRAEIVQSQKATNFWGIELKVGLSGSIVEDGDHDLLLQEDVVVRQSSMDDVLGVEVGECIGHLDQDRELGPGVQRLSMRHGLVQRVRLDTVIEQNIRKISNCFEKQTCALSAPAQFNN